jgi:CO/xanthine dehydrogenase Mo-binding subunit
MKMTELFPSKYLRSSDLSGRSRIAIVDRVTYEAFQNDGRTETKAVLHFKGNGTKPLVANKTNCLAMVSLAGSDDADDWSGTATYAYEYRHDEAPLYGVLVTATIGRGRIRKIDSSQAEKSRGVHAVVTHQTSPAQGDRNAPSPFPLNYWRARPTLTSAQIGHYGEPVALVVAATLEQAQAAANLVRITYAPEPGHFDLKADIEKAYAPKSLMFGLPTDSAVGNFQAAFDSAPVKIDHEYNTAYCFSQPMEPNACVAVPRGEDLELYVSTQIVDAARSSVANTLKIDPQKIKVVSSYVGGGFGSKLSVQLRDHSGRDRCAPPEPIRKGRADAPANLS